MFRLSGILFYLFGSTIDLSAARASDDAFSGVSATVHSVLCDCFMNPSSTQRCSICSRGVKNPSMFTITILPLYRPSCFQVMISRSSSRVPHPPGRATTASAIATIRSLRVWMSGVTTVCVRSPSVVGHEFRNHAHRLATVVETSVGKIAHQSLVACAAHNGRSLTGKSRAEAIGGVKIPEVDILARSAIYTDGRRHRLVRNGCCRRSSVCTPCISADRLLLSMSLSC